MIVSLQIKFEWLKVTWLKINIRLKVAIGLLIKKDSELGPSHPIYSKSFEHFALDNIYELTKFHDHIIYGWIDMFKTIPSHMSQFSSLHEFRCLCNFRTVSQMGHVLSLKIKRKRVITQDLTFWNITIFSWR